MGSRFVQHVASNLSVNIPIVVKEMIVTLFLAFICIFPACRMNDPTSQREHLTAVQRGSSDGDNR